MKNINYRKYCPDDYEAIRKLINLIQPEQPWSKEYFDWQYLNNPAGKAKVWIAEYQNKIIANYAAIPHHFKVNEQIHLAWRVQDVLTHADFRKMGIMHELSALCTNDISTGESPLNFTFPNQHSHTSFIRQNWVKAYRIPLMIATNLHEKVKSISDNIDSVYAISIFKRDLDELWNIAKNDFCYTVSRTLSYLTWRYLNRPGARYYPFIDQKDGSLEGLLVMKYYDLDKSIRLAHICELFVAPGKHSSLRKLLTRALKFAVETGADRITAWLPPGHLYEPAYKSFGFCFDNNIDRWLIVKSRQGIEGVEMTNNWHLSMGDSDVY
jgi:hypothetical protein